MPKLGWPRPGPGRRRPQVFAFGIRASGEKYGFAVEIAPAKSARSGLSIPEIAGQARDYAIAVMRSRGHDPRQIHATKPRQIRWESDSARFRYCQHFGFGPNGLSNLFLNRPPPGEIDRLAEMAFAAEAAEPDAD